MYKKHFRKAKEIKRRYVKSSDSNTPRRDATCVSRTSLPTPLMVSLERSSQDMETLRASSSSLRMVNLSMPSSATNPPITLPLPDNNWTCQSSTASSFMLTTTSLRKLERSNKWYKSIKCSSSSLVAKISRTEKIIRTIDIPVWEIIKVVPIKCLPDLNKTYLKVCLRWT